MIFYVAVCGVSAFAGFLACAIMQAGSIADLREAAVYWHRRAQRLEQHARSQQPTFGYEAPPNAQQQGLRVITGGRR